MPKRREPQEFIADITVEPDGIDERVANHWTRDKLGILASYCSAYADACASARTFHFIDAMAGYGRCYIRDTGEHLLGSTLIALETTPRFTSVLALEQSDAAVAALRARTVSYGTRAIVERGNCNRDLFALMEKHVPPRAPSFVLLDPEGAELEWQTVRSVARFREGPRKCELLILFATEGVNRMLPVEADIDEHNAARLDQLFPPDFNWRATWSARRNGGVTPSQARLEYVEGYMGGLKALGYQFVLRREVARANGALVYHLVCATDHPAGERIMDYVFHHMHPNDPQGRLFD